ncbi:hypothetical protein BDB00DRAFT_943696 [Zychaea mexicana]|uniref:uncharacterized protein n=1 Tax=Zychaea mexicana TaxID=64656 RepID=UPI0022FE46B5|nr:uncharacterized protein BDB00DRAFT_943696 [Zychaea mexicana]KAI9471388.1 hypothetical protein BDB00DRAFT_943696 [Zychaea mexicana]
MDPYTSKVAVITGGSRGIGYNVAAALVAKGAKVVLGDILDKEGEAAAKELNTRAGKQVAAYIHTDVTKYKDLIALFALAEKTFGGVDIAMLNAGIAGESAGGVFTPLDDRADMLIHEVNIGGVIKGNKVALLHMAKRGKGGIIINTASIAGFSAMPSIAAYCATKHAVVGWSRSLVNMQSVCGVRVNAVCPYWCETDIIANPASDVARRFLEATPKTTMEYVVQAFEQCIEDSDMAGETLLVLPDGIHVQPSFIPPECCFTSEFLEKVPQLTEDGNKETKKKLAQAIKAAKL